MSLGSQYKIWIALGVTVFCVLMAVWQVANLRGSRERGRHRFRKAKNGNEKRESDKRRLGPLEKKMLYEAQNLLSKGKVASGSRMLEQLGMHREAIEALEENGLIHEAAKILMRMQRHNRAGVIYARHGMWTYAAQCFRMANMPLEVAKCAKEAGEHAMAAEFFEKAERFEESADSHFVLGNIRKAAGLYLRAAIHSKAITAYEKLGKDEQDLMTVTFEPFEIDFICLSLTKKEVLSTEYKGLVNILVLSGRTVELLNRIILDGYIHQAKYIYKRVVQDIGPQLMVDINYQSPKAENFATMFLEAGDFQYAAIVYEKMNSFAKAGDCFEKAEDFDRALYCYERAGIEIKISSISAKIKGSGKKDSSVKKGAPQFVMIETLGESPPGRNAPTAIKDNLPEPEESTKIIRAFDAPQTPPLRLTSLPPKATPLQMFSLASCENSQIADNVPAPERTEELPPSPIGRQALPIELELPLDSDENSLKSHFFNAKFFAELQAPQKEELWLLGESKSFPTGSMILTYQDEPLGIYVILKGAVDCFRIVAGTETFLDRVAVSDSFGELWLLTDTPSTVKFVASEDSVLRVVYRSAFNNFLDRDGTIARKVYKRFTNKLLMRLLSPQNDNGNKIAS